MNGQQPRIFPQQNVPGNIPFPAQSGLGPVPDITQIQPVCNVRIPSGKWFSQMTIEYTTMIKN